MVEVRLSAVRVDLVTHTPVVLLQETEGQRALPIFIGAAEASAIAYALDQVAVARPLTHDLFKDVIIALGASVVDVVVTEIRDKTYYAEIHLRLGEQRIDVSARPSDAIALAVRVNVPIYVEDELMLEAGIVIEAEEEEEEPEHSEVIVGEFREFLSNVRPEDFSP